MGLHIHFTERDKQRVHDRHDEHVATRLEKAISRKNKTLQWTSSIDDCTPRFHNVIRQNGEYFPELSFSAAHRKYRAILVWVPDYERFIVYHVVEKEEHYQSSRQHKILSQVHRHPERIVKEAKEKLTTERDRTPTDC